MNKHDFDLKMLEAAKEILKDGKANPKALENAKNIKAVLEKQLFPKKNKLISAIKGCLYDKKN
tara:strand:+ start:2404 stop:2592 length:189 start_codon:yes stop_codon:yes gene_type:complete